MAVKLKFGTPNFHPGRDQQGESIVLGIPIVRNTHLTGYTIEVKKKSGSFAVVISPLAIRVQNHLRIFNHVAVRHLQSIQHLSHSFGHNPEVQGVTQEPLIGWSPLVGWHLHSWVCLRRRFLDPHERRQSDCN